MAYSQNGNCVSYLSAVFDPFTWDAYTVVTSTFSDYLHTEIYEVPTLNVIRETIEDLMVFPGLGDEGIVESSYIFFLFYFDCFFVLSSSGQL